MKRESTNQNLDKKVYRNTANTVKRMNLSNKPMRGGIRL